MHVCRLYYIVYDEVVVATGSIMAVQQRDEISDWGTPKFYVHQKCKCELVSLTGKTERMRRIIMELCHLLVHRAARMCIFNGPSTPLTAPSLW